MKRSVFNEKMKETAIRLRFSTREMRIIALSRWYDLASDAMLLAQPRPLAFRGMTLARNCRSEAEVDAALGHALSIGATLLSPAQKTDYGGYCGYFAHPDGHPWEAVIAPGLVPDADGRIVLPD